jgi:hypothetical protein
MKKIAILLILLFSINSICQTSNNNNDEIIGIWQAETSEVSSNYHDIYRFLSNNKFEFEPTGYNGLNRIVKISGNFKIKNDKIIFYPHAITELVGNKIERSFTTTLSDSWAIESEKLISKKIKSSPQSANFELNKPTGDNKINIKIDSRIFYKILE